MIDEISKFFYSFKNKIIEANMIVSKYSDDIKKYSNFLDEANFYGEYEENILTILGYSYRLDDISQRLYFTFQEAIYAIDLDKLMKNQESLKMNCIVYTFVLDILIKEYKTKLVDEELREKALKIYSKIEESRAKENKKYHMYQN